MTRDGAEFARGNEATQRYGIPDDAQSIEFSLECETGAGEKATAKTILTF